VLLTLMGAFFSAAVALVSADWTTPTAALGLGTVFGLGAAGALGAVNVPPPHAERVGLRGIRMRHVLPLLLLVPVALLASELDNAIQSAFPPPDAPKIVQETLQKLPTHGGLAVTETLIVAVGIVPLIEEWFFRGVLQQGLVASLGARAGVFVTALLFALGHGGPGLSVQSWSAVVAQALVLGWVFGYARLHTGSLLAPIFLHVGVNGLGVLALASPEVISIPGYNAPGRSPAEVLVPCVVAVGFGIALLARERPPPVPEVAAADADRSGDG
jgi:membrane protease YdiL (CAAX protease family)